MSKKKAASAAYNRFGGAEGNRIPVQRRNGDDESRAGCQRYDHDRRIPRRRNLHDFDGWRIS